MQLQKSAAPAIFRLKRGSESEHSMQACAARCASYSGVGPTLMLSQRREERRRDAPRESVLPGSLQLADADAVFGLDSLMTLGERCGVATTWNTLPKVSIVECETKIHSQQWAKQTPLTSIKLLIAANLDLLSL